MKREELVQDLIMQKLATIAIPSGGNGTGELEDVITGGLWLREHNNFAPKSAPNFSLSLPLGRALRDDNAAEVGRIVLELVKAYIKVNAEIEADEILEEYSHDQRGRILSK